VRECPREGVPSLSRGGVHMVSTAASEDTGSLAAEGGIKFLML
jgi:hypothetical protein